MAGDARLLRRLRRLLRRPVGDALDERRLFLLRMLPKRSVGAEIGVWKGDFAAAVLRVVRPTRLHLVDPWTFETGEPYEGAWYGGGIARGQADMDAIHEEVRRRFEDEIERGVVVVHRGPSAEVGPSFEDGYFDWVYVDGNHLYEFVRRDLEIFGVKLRPDGLMAGDDYGVPGWWEDGVTRAVDELVERGGWDVLHLSNQFVLRKLG